LHFQRNDAKSDISCACGIAMGNAKLFQTSGYRDWVNSARGGHRYDHFHAIGNPIRVGSDNLIS
jgi:hypothetical protein